MTLAAGFASLSQAARMTSYSHMAWRKYPGGGGSGIGGRKGGVRWGGVSTDKTSVGVLIPGFLMRMKRECVSFETSSPLNHHYYSACLCTFACAYLFVSGCACVCVRACARERACVMCVCVARLSNAKS